MAENKKISGLTPMGTKTLGDVAGFAGYIAAADGVEAYNIKCTGQELMDGIFKIQSTVEEGIAQSKIEAKDNGTIEFSVSGENDYRWELNVNGHFIPNANAAYDLGNAEFKVRHLFLSDSSIFMGSGDNTTIQSLAQISLKNEDDKPLLFFTREGEGALQNFEGSIMTNLSSEMEGASFEAGTLTLPAFPNIPEPIEYTAEEPLEISDNVISYTGEIFTSEQAKEIEANTAKESFPGFGTTVGTALEGNTTIGNGTLTITVNGTEAGSFAANETADKEIEITAGSGGDGVQTLASLTWDYNEGNSAIFTPSDNESGPIDVLVASNFPAGARGSLKVIPTNTVKFGLFEGSKIPSSQNILTISAVNPTILNYFYDGDNFYWFYDINYIDAVNPSPAAPDPSVDEENLLGFYFPGSTSLANGANVPFGTGWEKSSGGSLINTLTRTGDSNASAMKYFARNEDEKVAPYWQFTGADVAWRSTVAAGGSDIRSWSASCYFKVTEDTGTGYNGLFDPNTNDQEAIYLYQEKLQMYSPTAVIQGNYPAFTAANNLLDKWIFTHVDVVITNEDEGTAIIFCYIGNQLTRDACTDNGGSGVIEGTDGEEITLTPNGLCLFGPTEVDLGAIEEGWETIIYGSAESTTGTLYQYTGDLGMVAFYRGQTSADAVSANWDSTRASYYIT